MEHVSFHTEGRPADFGVRSTKKMDSQHDQALTPGYRLGPFEVTAVLGAGSFGITYRADDRNLDRTVAVKEYFPFRYAKRGADGFTVQPISRRHVRSYQWGLRVLLNEARALGKFRHPSIVRVSQLFKLSNTAYIVMDYERGATLDAVLKSTRHFTTSRISQLARELLSGLCHLHRSGVVHCDIAPRNLIVRDDGTIVLIDFGAVRTVWDADVTMGTGNRYTPAYAPPELWFAHAPSGPWTDLFCLGAVLFHCITGVAPLDARNRQRLIDNARRGRDPVHGALQQLRSSRSARLLDTVRWMLELSPSDRPQRAEDALEALSDDWQDDSVPPPRHTAHRMKQQTPADSLPAPTSQHNEPASADAIALFRRRLLRSLSNAPHRELVADLVCDIAARRMSEEQVLDSIVGLRNNDRACTDLTQAVTKLVLSNDSLDNDPVNLTDCLVALVRAGRNSEQANDD